MEKIEYHGHNDALFKEFIQCCPYGLEKDCQWSNGKKCEIDRNAHFVYNGTVPNDAICKDKTLFGMVRNETGWSSRKINREFQSFLQEHKDNLKFDLIIKE